MTGERTDDCRDDPGGENAYAGCFSPSMDIIDDDAGPMTQPTSLRGFLGDGAEWRLPDNDVDRIKETLKELRDEQPIAPDVLRGRRHGDTVILWVRGTDRDDIARTGRVRMLWKDRRWSVGEQDLDAP
jgi:hypothetical protein